MPATQTLYQVTTPQASLSVQGKSPACYPRPAQPALYNRPVLSPPSIGSSVNTSAVPSLTSGSYAGSALSDNETKHSSAHGVDLIDMMTDRLAIAVDPLPLDRSLARQAQMSGGLNSKQRELLELQALAQRRLRSTRANLADGMKAAKEVRQDLEWTQKRVTALNAKAARKYPAAYKSASDKHPTPNGY